MSGDLPVVKRKVRREVIESIKRFRRAVVREGLDIDSIFLFGSQVGGKVKPYSDIDIGVVSRSFGKDVIDEAAKLRLLASKIDWRLEPHPLHPDDLQVRENPFVYEILSTGIRIV
jgi:predicted nucleotidyltransferase